MHRFIIFYSKMKTRYYRHHDPRRGFKLCEQLQIPNSQRLKYMPFIQQINSMYNKCAQIQSKSLLSQPDETRVLENIFILLLLPLLLCHALEMYGLLFPFYVVAMGGIAYFGWVYFQGITRCRVKFDQANRDLVKKFRNIQQQFQKEWPGYSMVLLKEWNQFNETCVEYIEIFQKQHPNVQQKQLEVIEQKQEISSIEKEDQPIIE